jgi:hypothetical protein
MSANTNSGGIAMKQAVMCMSIVAAFMINSYSAIAQTPPKYEIFEYANGSTQLVNYNQAILIDRVANKIWDCHGDLLPATLTPAPTLGCFELQQVVKAGGEAFPNLAQLATAQQRTITSKYQSDQGIWLVDQSNGNVHFCYAGIQSDARGNGVFCYALPRHPPV